MTIDFNNLSNVTFDGTVYNEVTKASDNTTATTQEKSNVTYDNFLLHSSKEWLSTIEGISTELVKEVKDTSSKVKADGKILEAAKKAAADPNPFKDTNDKIKAGINDLAANVAAMTEVTNYSGAINFISTTAVNTVTGSITNVSDMGTYNKSPSITNTSNVVVNNAATSLNYSDTVFRKTDRDITVTNQQLLSATDKHNLVTNTTSTTSTSNKTTAVEDHQVVASDQRQYSDTHTTLTSKSIVIGSKGDANLITKGVLTIGAGQTDKTAASQASTAQADNIGNPISDLNTGGTGSIKIISNGDINTISSGTIANQSSSWGAAAVKIGLSSIDFASNSTTSTILSKTQTTVSSDGITYTGNKNVGISINPFGILAGTGIAPLIPFLSQELPPIVLDIPELPQFPFGDLNSFLSKCLPFASSALSAVGGLGGLGGDTTATVIDPEGPADVPIADGPEPALITLEDPIVPQNKADSPITLDSSSANDPKVVKGIKGAAKDRDVTTTASVKTDPKTKPIPFTAKQAVGNAAKLGILHKVFIDPPEGPTANTTTTTTSSDTPQIAPIPSVGKSLQTLMSYQQAEVVNSFNVDQRAFINSNYSDFLQAVAVVDTYGSGLSTELSTNAAVYSANVLKILKNNSYATQIQTFLNTKRPAGIGGQQPSNIQDNIGSPISDNNTGGNTPPNPGQGIIDVLTSLDTSKQSSSLFSTTTENWFTPEKLDNMTFSFGDDLTSNANISGISDLLNNKYVQLAVQAIPNTQIQSALSLTQDIVAGNIKTPEEYASRLASLVGGNASGYLAYAQQAMSIYGQVQNGNYSSLLSIPGISNVLGSQGTAIASGILDLVSKKNPTDQDIYSLAGSIFSALTGSGISLLDQLAKLLGCISSLQQQQPTLQNIPDSNLQDIIDYLPRVIQTVPAASRNRILNITPTNCDQISILSAEEATINLSEIGLNYVKFTLANKDLIRFNNNPLPDIGTPVNLYAEYFTDRIANRVLAPYKFTSQFTSNVLEYKIIDSTNNIYTAVITDPSVLLTMEDTVTGALYQYTTNDIGDRLIPYVLDSYILL